MVSLNAFALIFCGLTAIITKGNVPMWLTILMVILTGLNGVIVFNAIA
jgi:hypothetical protein